MPLSKARCVSAIESLTGASPLHRVDAKSSYVKARAPLQRATPTILETDNISIDAAAKVQMG